MNVESPCQISELGLLNAWIQAQHTAATTFNEADSGPNYGTSKSAQEAFKAKHGVALSFMSFFTAASIEALKVVRSQCYVDGRDVVYHDYFDIGIAVKIEPSLVVPVVRDAGKMSFVEIEKKIAELAIRARKANSLLLICQVELSRSQTVAFMDHSYPLLF